MDVGILTKWMVLDSLYTYFAIEISAEKISRKRYDIILKVLGSGRLIIFSFWGIL
jgi:uncharacterized membrane protein YhfC